MNVVFEAIVVSAIMLLIFFLAFFLVFLLAISMFPFEKELSKIVWDNAAKKPRKTVPIPRKGGFPDFS